jgi:cell wall-associated NlpC family hydrolase
LKALEGLSTATRPRTSRDRFAAPTPDGFRLTGPSARLDPRTHAFRPDIADVALAGTLFAPHYVRPEPVCCAALSVPMRARPSAEAPAVSQLIHGEGFALLDQAGGWAWGYSLHDHYVGYIPADALGPVTQPTHRIIVPSAPAFSHPDIKSPVVAHYPLGARIAGEDSDGYLRIAGGYLHPRHVAPLDTAIEPATAAAAMAGLPYLWGGRGAGGIDCSGLVQRALEFGGIDAPRDSDQQRDALGTMLAEDAPLQRGDLVFFPGHVGIMADGERLIHANAFWMGVAVEPLADVVARLAGSHPHPISARRRITA